MNKWLEATEKWLVVDESANWGKREEPVCYPCPNCGGGVEAPVAMFGEEVEVTCPHCGKVH